MQQAAPRGATQHGAPRPSAADALPLTLRGRELAVDGAAGVGPLLCDLRPGVTTAPEADVDALRAMGGACGHGVVVGVTAPEGPIALADLVVGKVGGQGEVGRFGAWGCMALGHGPSWLHAAYCMGTTWTAGWISASDMGGWRQHWWRA